MKHRFLHTLVFSSVLALEGCASTPPETLEAEASASGSGAEVVERASAPVYAENESADGSASAGSSSGSSSGSSRGSASGSRAPEPAAAVEAQADVVAMRECEVGWGTTKSGRRQIDPWDCSAVSVEGVERTECTDASGRCLQP